LLAVKPAAMRPEQAAAYIGVSVTTIRRLIGKGELEKRRIGAAIVVLTRSLDAYLEGGV
jgi:excisionase family DNA binding protein